MPGPPHSRLDRRPQRGEEEPPGAPASPMIPDRVGWRFAAAAIALSSAALLSPIAVVLLAATAAAPWPPLAVGALLALLLLTPAAAGIAAALVGWRRLAALGEAGGDAEHAVWRVLVATLLFASALVLAARAPQDAATADCLALAAAGLMAAWALLTCVLWWPGAPPLRRYAMIVFDVAWLSAFLHFGGSAAAACYPLYLVAVCYAGLRFGLGALLVGAVAAILGFAAVIASTDIWARTPALAAGLLVTLAVLPAFLAAALRGAAAARACAAAAETGGRRALLLISETLRHRPGMAGAGGAPAAPFRDLVDFAAIEAGSFASPVESFDLRPLVTRSLAPLQEGAAERGLALRWRLDPRLPPRLRGRAQAIARLLSGLADHAIAVAPTGTAVGITIDAAGDASGDAAGDAGRRIRLRVRVEGLDARREQGSAPDEAPLALRLVQRLAALSDGSFAAERPAGRRSRVTVTLPLAVEEGLAAPDPAPDLGGRPVVVVTEDEALARRLAEPLAAWNAEPSWPDDPEAALAELCRGGERPVAIVDGRDQLLAALGLAHRAAQLGAIAPFVVLVAEEARIASLADVDEGALDGFLPAPVRDELLANVLAALPLAPERPPASLAAARPAARDAAPADGERITPIAAHPRFAPEPAAVDPRAIDGLRALGGGSAFLREVIETFRADAGQAMRRIEATVAAGDAAGFARAVAALHRAASHLGGTQLCELLASLQQVTAGELRQQGSLHLRRLDAEVDRLAAALSEFLPAAEAGRP